MFRIPSYVAFSSLSHFCPVTRKKTLKNKIFAYYIQSTKSLKKLKQDSKKVHADTSYYIAALEIAGASTAGEQQVATQIGTKNPFFRHILFAQMKRDDKGYNTREREGRKRTNPHCKHSNKKKASAGTLVSPRYYTWQEQDSNTFECNCSCRLANSIL